jgi:hypothetical protein
VTCIPGQSFELPGSNVACATLDVRECLAVGGSEIVAFQTVSARLVADVSSVSVPPVYSTLLTVPITVNPKATRLAILMTAGPRHTGAAINVAINFRVRLDGLPITPGGGTTVNCLVNQIQSASYSVVIPVTPGPHVVTVQWGGFGLGANTMFISPVLLPDLQAAMLIVSELA